MSSPRDKKYKRILLKLSGEELMGAEGFGIDPKVLDKMALEMVRKTVAAAAPPKILLGNTYTYIIPVAFRLQN